MESNRIDSAPGIWHDIKVKYVTSAELSKLVNDPSEDLWFGHWDEGSNTIYINSDLDEQQRRQTYYHEISHHVIEELEQIGDEETKCNVLGAFFMKLLECERGEI